MTPQIDHHLTANAHMKKRDILIGNFLGGLAWGFGTVVGASLVVAMLVYMLRGVGLFDPVKALLNDAQFAPSSIEKQITK